MNENRDRDIHALLCGYIEKASEAADSKALEQLTEEYAHLLSEVTAPELVRLRDLIFALSSQLADCREKLGHLSKDRRASLSEAEKHELSLVQKLIDNNLFTYHFQPIVRADNGEIYSYEALMRSGEIEGITPFHILKYAELTDRLGVIEQYTFMNVLKYISEHRSLFENKHVFINSMPSVHMSHEKESEIEKTLASLSDIVVVEMTEQSEFSERELDNIKEKYRRLNIGIAIDDYGTGYSNISNLLRYTPNYVKIDRALLSGIQDNPNKKHFVREIIDFCHDNDILALAEGIENADELRAVILLGVDLIQGYYTARPGAEVVQSIPYDRRVEIRVYREEREHGRRMKIYSAAAGERVSLDKLSKEGYSCVLIGSEFSGGTVIVAGSPSVDTDIHIETADGFGGKIVLSSAHLSNTPQSPCISFGDDNDAELQIDGDNRLMNSGIKVPPSSRVTFTGSGLLEITLGNADYYGIGNDLASAHGELVFRHDARVKIRSTSHSGVCIGSGLGGRISIHSGEYILEAHGSSGVCIGSFDGDDTLSILNCDLEAKAAGACNTVIGSMNGSSVVKVNQSSVRCYGYSQLISAIGTVRGGSSDVYIENSSMTITLNGSEFTACGSLNGDSRVHIEGCTFRAEGDGGNALMIGGQKGRSELWVTNADAAMTLSTALGRYTMAADSDIHINGGRCAVELK